MTTMRHNTVLTGRYMVSVSGDVWKKISKCGKMLECGNCKMRLSAMKPRLNSIMSHIRHIFLIILKLKIKSRKGEIKEIAEIRKGELVEKVGKGKWKDQIGENQRK